MSEWIKELFVTIFGSHSEIATFLISMIPIVELRGAIPFGSATAFWGENALSLWVSFGVSVLGSTLVCVILTFLFWPIFNWFKKTKWFKKLADFIERKLNKNSQNIQDKAKAEKSAKKVFWLKFWGVVLFVAIPLPLTGVWTGTCLGLFLGLTKWQTMAAVIPGNVCAGLIMTLVSYFFADNTMIVLLAFLALVVLFVLYEVIKTLIEKKINKKKALAGESDETDEEVVESTIVEETSAKEVEKEIISQIDDTAVESEESNDSETAIEEPEKLEEK